MNKIQQKLIFIIIFAFSFLLYNHPTLAFNDYGLDETAKTVNAFKNQVGSTSSGFLQDRLGQIIGLVLSLIGVVFFVLIIYAGINWMLSGGNEQKITKSKDLILNATIGLIIVFAAYAITSFLGNQLGQP